MSNIHNEATARPIGGNDYVLELPSSKQHEYDAARSRLEEVFVLSLLALLGRQSKEIAADPGNYIEIIGSTSLLAEEVIANGLTDGFAAGVDFAAAHFAAGAFPTRTLLADGAELVGTFAPALTNMVQRRTVAVVGGMVREWVDAGRPVGELTSRLGVHLGRDRAEKIGITEMTRFYAEGTVRAYRYSNLVTGVMWLTSNDDRVCPICAPLGGLDYENEQALPASAARQRAQAATTNLYSRFVHPGGNGKAEKYRRLYFFPPAHVRCRCRIAPVVRYYR